MFNMFLSQLVKWYKKYWSKTIDYVVSKYKTYISPPQKNKN